VVDALRLPRGEAEVQLRKELAKALYRRELLPISQARGPIKIKHANRRGFRMPPDVGSYSLGATAKPGMGFRLEAVFGRPGRGTGSPSENGLRFRERDVFLVRVQTLRQSYGPAFFASVDNKADFGVARRVPLRMLKDEEIRPELSDGQRPAIPVEMH
jgi:hypothetical protein